MSVVPSKRQQARNERTLQEIIKSVPGNDRCADCQTRNPGWASWSLGVFLCMRCAALHRKLGTHVSKVKSLSMDSWSNDQVETMKRNGNAISNRTFNPLNQKPQIPLDVDEVDLAMERFIRQKYELRVFSGGSARPTARHNTGSTSTSSEDQPPPLPPKPSHRFRFGLRAASSTLPTSRVSYESPPLSPKVRRARARSPSPVRVNKPSRVFGASVGPTGESFESKLATLRDMGFSDDRRNSTVLKGLSGNLERTVESLVRLGEGGATTKSRSSSLPRSNDVQVSVPDRSNGAASVPQKINPFDLPENRSAQAQQQVGVSVLPSPRPQQINGSQIAESPTSYNPFDSPGPQRSASQPIEQSFQGLQVSQHSTTASFPSQQQQDIQYQQYPVQYSTSSLAEPFRNPYHQQNQQQHSINGASNPFFQATQPISSAPTTPNLTQYSENHIFAQQNQYQAQLQQQHQQQQQFYQQHPHQQIQHHQSYTYPHQLSLPTNPHQVEQQPVVRADKNSILALYNYPHLAPTPPPSLTPTSPSSPLQTAPATNLPPGVAANQGQRSVSTPLGPLAGTRNPFLATTNGLGSERNVGTSGVLQEGGERPMQGGNKRHASQESVDVGFGWQSGRHSPDAFKSLSARFVR